MCVYVCANRDKRRGQRSRVNLNASTPHVQNNESLSLSVHRKSPHTRVALKHRGYSWRRGRRELCCDPEYIHLHTHKHNTDAYKTCITTDTQKHTPPHLPPSQPTNTLTHTHTHTTHTQTRTFIHAHTHTMQSYSPSTFVQRALSQLCWRMDRRQPARPCWCLQLQSNGKKNK